MPGLTAKERETHQQIARRLLTEAAQEQLQARARYACADIYREYGENEIAEAATRAARAIEVHADSLFDAAIHHEQKAVGVV